MRTVVSILLLLLVLAPVGCARSAAPRPSSARPAEQPASEPAEQPVAPRPVQTMSPEQKRAAIAENFPAEIPVPVGEVVRGESQGDTAWDYEIVVDTSYEELVRWYGDAYQGRSWGLAGNREVTGDDGAKGIEFTLRKGGAQCRVTIEPDGSKTRAVVVLGTGTDVLQTQ